MRLLENKRWYEELAKMKAEIKKYPLLERAIDFERYCVDSYGNENAILLLILNQSQEPLQMLEELLSNSNSPLDSNDRTSVIERLNNLTSPNDILSVITELDIISVVLKKVPSPNVKHNPPLANGKHADIQVKISDKEVYMEVFNSVKGKPDMNIEEIMHDSLVYLIERINRPCCLDLQVDTAKFPTLQVKSEKRIDIDGAKNKLKSEIDELRFDLIPNQLNTYFIRELCEYLETKNYLESNNLGFKIKGIFKEETPEINFWRNSLNLNAIKKTELIDNVLCFPTEKSKCVQMQELGQFPSEALKLEIDSFINRFIRTLKGKIKEQTHPDFPNIIISQWHHWIQVTDYYHEIINRLASIIKSDIFTVPEAIYLSGVAIFTTICPIDLNKAVYIANAKVNSTSKLTQEDISILGFDGIKYT